MSTDQVFEEMLCMIRCFSLSGGGSAGESFDRLRSFPAARAAQEDVARAASRSDSCLQLCSHASHPAPPSPPASSSLACVDGGWRVCSLSCFWFAAGDRNSVGSTGSVGSTRSAGSGQSTESSHAPNGLQHHASHHDNKVQRMHVDT